MMKFMCLCFCAIASVSASAYGRPRGGYGGAPVGGYAYQVQPAWTVKAVIPSYGGGYGPQPAYAAPPRYEAAPLASAYSGANVGADLIPAAGYGGAPPVDRQAIALAKLALAAPNPGPPLVWNEPPRHVQPVYPPISVGPQEYGPVEKVRGGSAAAAASSVAAGKKAAQKPRY